MVLIGKPSRTYHVREDPDKGIAIKDLERLAVQTDNLHDCSKTHAGIVDDESLRTGTKEYKEPRPRYDGLDVYQQ